MQENIIPHNFEITNQERTQLKGHKALLLWFTGLSGSGKSTLANAVEQALFNQNIHTYTLDGDNVRKGLNSDLSFAPSDRTENIRRIAETAHLFIDAGIVVLAAFVSPYKKDREMVKKTVKDVNFVEIFVNTPLEECEKRDVKGLYAKARKGLIKDFTGVNAPYEVPENPDVTIDTTQTPIADAVKTILETIQPKLQA
ncbi:adenylyl-sulfate kinase [Marixanthomonas spongiae]|uniref:Adenylyl-sulfate kinase n=1 Tax=Marixanthomonas spongiae TaxID=2174845 RepID=A0A2U0I3S7_9FLAO|nr:adenylyl-sulfate kinase [Marixanthomonas spongiae]PVW15767.1 adenylyl-sulfate kinase [Marixanthomonas spongiae]